jgi:hypothetical protein
VACHGIHCGQQAAFETQQAAFETQQAASVRIFYFYVEKMAEK